MKKDDEEPQALTNLSSGMMMPSKATERLLSSQKLGVEKMEKFVEERLVSTTVSFWDPMPKLRIDTFATLTKKVILLLITRWYQLKGDRELFGCLLVVAKGRDIDLKRVLSYELSPVPLSLAHLDGTLRKTPKSVLLTEIENTVKVESTMPHQTKELKTAHIFDAMAQSTQAGKLRVKNIQRLGKETL